jgi:hypothetical protein
MKRLMLLVILLSFIVTMNAQMSNNSVSVSYQPADHGIGLKGTYYFTPNVGMYGSITYGTLGSYKLVGYENHIKLTTGVVLPLNYKWDRDFSLTVGLNYHYQNGIEDYILPENVTVNHNMFNKPVSFELGVRKRTNRFTLGFRTDILRWEPCIDVGYAIGRTKKRIK